MRILSRALCAAVLTAAVATPAAATEVWTLFNTYPTPTSPPGFPASAGFVPGVADMVFGPDDLGHIVRVSGANTTSGTWLTSNLTTFTAIAEVSKTVTYHWEYGTADMGTVYDPGGYTINGVLTQLSLVKWPWEGSMSHVGEVTFDVQAGDQYGFYIFSGDSTRGSASIYATLVSSIPSVVPEPGTWALLIAGFALTGAALRSRSRQAVEAYDAL